MPVSSGRRTHGCGMGGKIQDIILGWGGGVEFAFWL